VRLDASVASVSEHENPLFQILLHERALKNKPEMASNDARMLAGRSHPAAPPCPPAPAGGSARVGAHRISTPTLPGNRLRRNALLARLYPNCLPRQA